ncbi:MAG TPA: putative lipid II flippase FtsW [Acidimicrobiales bacterium]|nr:putative lipid II flippase FtsW [Acidimicrobiales bacterium]
MSRVRALARVPGSIRAAGAPAVGQGGRSNGFVLLLSLTVALDLIGLVMVLSASSVEALARYGSSWVFFEKQLLWVVLGAVAMVLTMRVDYRRWRRWSLPLVGASLALLFAVLVPHVGVSVSGSSRWLGLGSFRVQPSELVKLALVVYMADVLSRRVEKGGAVRDVLGGVMVVYILAAALIFKQPDMGTALVVSAIVFGLLFAAGLPRWTMAKLMGGAVLAAFVLGMAEPYRKARLLSFLHPWADRSSTGYQVVQSLVGLGSGGVAGVGLGASRAKWGFLPNAHTDFIFSIVGEELGLIGAVLVVGLFAAFALVGLRAAKKAPDPFGALLAVGISVWITAQAVLNIGAVIGILPVTGVPLPLVSFGGSSLTIVMGAIGILLNIARQERR